MKKIIFSFPKLPNTTNVGKWKLGVEKDFKSELSNNVFLLWNEDKDENPLLEATVTISEEEDAICMMHNLHGAKVV